MAAKAAAAARSRSKSTSAKATAKRVVPAAAAPKKRATKKAVAKKTPTKNASAKKPASRKARTVVGNVVTPAAWGPAQRTEELAKALGGVTALARALGVSPSQPSRWKSGKESPSDAVARRLIDLDHVVARAQLVWNPEVVPTW